MSLDNDNHVETVVLLSRKSQDSYRRVGKEIPDKVEAIKEAIKYFEVI